MHENGPDARFRRPGPAPGRLEERGGDEVGRSSQVRTTTMRGAVGRPSAFRSDAARSEATTPRREACMMPSGARRVYTALVGRIACVAEGRRRRNQAEGRDSGAGCPPRSSKVTTPPGGSDEQDSSHRRVEDRPVEDHCPSGTSDHEGTDDAKAPSIPKERRKGLAGSSRRSPGRSPLRTHRRKRAPVPPRPAPRQKARARGPARSTANPTMQASEPFGRLDHDPTFRPQDSASQNAAALDVVDSRRFQAIHSRPAPGLAARLVSNREALSSAQQRLPERSDAPDLRQDFVVRRAALVREGRAPSFDHGSRLVSKSLPVR